MRKVFSGSFLFALIVMLIGSANAGDWIEVDTYEAPTTSITIDGDAADWAGIEPLTGIEFKTTSDEWVVFEEYGGGTWSGPEDHTTSVAFAWDAAALYMYIMVEDDEFEHASDSAWNGDGVQLVFADAARTTITYLYNFALNGAQDAVLLDNEQPAADGLAEGDVVVVRDDDAKTTFYEARFAPEILGLSSLEADVSIGIGVCVNDGDIDTPGQKGWSGWGPHAAVFGKNAEKTGLVTLSATAPVVTAVEPCSKLPTVWGGLKK